MKAICASKADLGYNKNDSTWTIINETHWAFADLERRGFVVRDADEKEKKLFNVLGDELTLDDFLECGHDAHYPNDGTRGCFTHVCPECNQHINVRTRI